MINYDRIQTEKEAEEIATQVATEIRFNTIKSRFENGIGVQTIKIRPNEDNTWMIKLEINGGLEIPLTSVDRYCTNLPPDYYLV